MRESNPSSLRSSGDPLPDATRDSNVRSDSRTLVSSTDVSGQGSSTARRGDAERRSPEVAHHGSASGAARRTLFAGPETPICAAQRGRGLLVAFVLHLLALAPLLVSVTRYVPQPTPALEAVGVTFVMAPERGAGSPPPSSQPEPERRAPSPEAPKPIVSEPSAETPLLTADALTPLAAPPTLDALPRPVSSNRAGETSASDGSATADPVAPTGSGPGGRRDSSLPPAIGKPSGQSNWAGLVLGRLEQFRQYPAAARRRRQEGICYVRFTIDRDGHVRASSLERSSGYDLLDREAVALVRRAEPLPVPPPELEGDTVTLTVPVEFFLER